MRSWIFIEDDEQNNCLIHKLRRWSFCNYFLSFFGILERMISFFCLLSYNTNFRIYLTNPLFRIDYLESLVCNTPNEKNFFPDSSHSSHTPVILAKDTLIQLRTTIDVMLIHYFDECSTTSTKYRDPDLFSPTSEMSRFLQNKFCNFSNKILQYTRV